MEWVIPAAFLLAIALLITDTGGTLETVTLRLYQNDLTPTPTTVIGDFTQATFDGYAGEAVTWLLPSVSDVGVVEVMGTAGEFRPTGSVTPNTIFGWYITDGGGALMASGRFATAPIAMGSTLQSILATVIYRPQSAGGISVVT